MQKKLIIFFLFFVFHSAAAYSHPHLELLPHQNYVVDHLTNKDPQLKGLLLFHGFGSGKTILSLDFAEKFKKKSKNNVLILLPRFLEANWHDQMSKYGINNKSGYKIVSFAKSEKVLEMNLENTLVVIDEVHKLIQLIKSTDHNVSKKFSELYFKLRSAKKILALTGTPIFSEVSDIGYIGNLLSRKDLFYLDDSKFRQNYMKISPIKAFVRGHLFESKMFNLIVPFFSTLTAAVVIAGTAAWSIPLVSLGASAILPIVNSTFPTGKVQFRTFDPEKLRSFNKRYVSYYYPDMQKDKNFPKTNVFEKSVIYNEEQLNYFLSLIDKDLSKSELKLLFSENKNRKLSNSYLHFHSSKLQDQFISDPNSGREIGNFSLKGKVSPKFIEILKYIKSSPGKVAIYSSYFANGIKKFSRFLDSKGMENSYRILNPNDDITTQIKAVNDYNNNKYKILLIHPEITEGISLEATEQFHILEPIPNDPLLKQIIGRAVRFKSHVSLPKHRQKVDVYLWKSIIEVSNLGLPILAERVKRRHWKKRYVEVNPSSWTKGIIELDKNYFLKDETADQRVNRNKDYLIADIESYKEFSLQHSIETVSKKSLK